VFTLLPTQSILEHSSSEGTLIQTNNLYTEPALKIPKDPSSETFETARKRRDILSPPFSVDQRFEDSDGFR